MNLTELSPLLLSLVSLLFAITLGIYTWERRKSKGAVQLAIILFSEAFWILGFIFEMLSYSLQVRVFWDLFQWLFAPILALAVFDLASNFVKPPQKNNTLRLFIIAGLIATVLLVITNPIHNWVISKPELVANSINPVLYYEYSPADYVILGYIYAVVILSFIRLALIPIWSQKIYRLQLVSMLVGFGILIASSLFSLSSTPAFWGQRDVSVITFGLSNIVLSWGLFRFHLFDIEAVARNVVVDTIEYPMVVVDIFDQIVDSNSAAQSYFGFPLHNSNLVDASQLPLKWTQVFDRFRDTKSFKGEVRIQLDKRQRILDLTISPILNHGNLFSGRLFFIKDITEQKLADELVRESDESYTRLFNTVKEAIYVLSPDGVFLNVNDGAEKMYGYAREEFIGKTPAFLSAEGVNDLNAISDMLDRVFISGVSEEFEFVGKRKNGEGFPKECIASKGKYFGRDVIITTARDVTERKKVEVELKKRTDDLELINRLNDGFNRGESMEETIRSFAEETRRIFSCEEVSLLLLSSDKQFLELQHTTFSRTLLKMVEMLIGQHIPVVRIPFGETTHYKKIMETGQSLLTSDPEVIRELLEEIAQTPTLTPIARPLIVKVIPQIISLLRMKSTILMPLVANGESIGVINLANHNLFTEEDQRRIERFSGQITIAILRRKAENAVRESEERLHQLFETAMDGIALTRPDGTIHSVNRAAADLFGYSEQEIFSLTNRDFLDYSDPRMDRALEERTETGYFKGELTGIRKDGTRFPLEINSVLFKQKDILASTFLRDITESKSAEAERTRLLNELKSKNDELEQFTYTVSHDLKAPLFTIRGFLGYLEQDINANRPERVKDDLNHIASAADKMQRLINELLALSRIGRIMNSPTEISFGTIANDAVNLVAGRIADKQVIIEVAPNLPVVYCDRTRMIQVMQNLIDNAIKFMGRQAQPRIQIGHRMEDDKPVFFIRDNGMGIPLEYQSRIFGLFDKLDANTDGTGLGLALIKRIIETHGGKIWVESKGSGQGSTFCFTISKPIG